MQNEANKPFIINKCRFRIVGFFNSAAFAIGLAPSGVSDYSTKWEVGDLDFRNGG